MTPLEYAQSCAKRYSLSGVKIKGHGHVPRVEIDRSDPFFRPLPAEKVTEGRRRGGSYGRIVYDVNWYTSAEIHNAYWLELLAAGIDPNDGEIVSPRIWKTVCALIRFNNGSPLDKDFIARFSKRTSAITKARQTRLRNKLMTGDLTKEEERCADAAAHQLVALQESGAVPA